MTAQDLKNSILQLAVQGKLVPQGSNDEPASELLKRIHAEKERLVKEGDISIDKKHTPDPISEDDYLFDIPDSWCWARFADIVTFYSGKTPERHTPDYWNNGKHTWISIADMISDGITTSSKEKISKKAFEDCFSGKNTPAGTMIMSFKLTIGKVSILGVDAVHNEAIISIFPFIDDEIIKKYLFKILPLIANAGDSKNAIKGKTLNATSISNLMIPIPPLAEQERIVAKIEELLPLIEEYDKAGKRLSELNADFPDKLRKSILQQAVMGKLTERDPADEPASELLKRIRTEKEKLIKEGKIKKEKPLPPISDDEIPFEIPDTWEWVRWGDLSQSIQYGYNASAKSKGRIRMVRISDIQDGNVLWDTVPFCDISEEEISQYLLGKNDILFARTGGTVGKSFLVREVPYEAIYAGYLIRTQYSEKLCPQYMKYFMESQLYWDQLHNGTIATAQPNCNGQTLSKMILPLPPLAEQKRIVARVEELLKICDEMK